MPIFAYLMLPAMCFSWCCRRLIENKKWMCYIDEQKNKYSVLNECNRMLKYNILNSIYLYVRETNFPSTCFSLTCRLIEDQSYFTTDGQSASMSWYRAPLWDCDQILLLVRMLLSEICGLVSVGRPFWREDGSVFFHCKSVVIYQYLHQTFTFHVFYSSAIYTRYVQTSFSPVSLQQIMLEVRGSRFKVTLLLTVSQSFSQSVCFWYRARLWDQILLPVWMLLSEICGLVSVGRPLWRQDGSAICSVIPLWSESRRTRSHILLSHLRLLQPGEPVSRIYIPQEQGSPVILPFCITFI
jgi:hypothetical protein